MKQQWIVNILANNKCNKYFFIPNSQQLIPQPTA